MPQKADKGRDPTQLVGLQLRFKESLRAELERAAKSDGNSLNGEIVARLDRSLLEDELIGSGPTRALLIQIAGQVALVEARTGKLWHQDEATYEAARKLIDDALTRARPAPPNQEAIAKQRALCIELKGRRDALRKTLVDCGALVHHDSAFRRFLGPIAGDPQDYSEAPEERWHMPEKPEESLGDDERALVKQRIAKFREMDKQLATARSQLAAIEKPIGLSRAMGLVIYEQMVSDSDEDAKTGEV